MKKIIITILISLFAYSIASAEVGVNIGVSGNMGVFAAEARETVDEKQTTGDAIGVVGYGSIFIEKTLGDYLTIGVEHLPSALSTDTTEDNKCDTPTYVGCTAKVNSVQVDFSDLTTLYVSLNLNENFYIKAGRMSVDVQTNESLATGSAYGDTSLDGSMLGIGYNKTMDSGIFFRVEGTAMEFDGVSLTSTATTGNIVKLNQLNGISGKISVGKSF
jgi:hypothetical protein